MQVQRGCADLARPRCHDHEHDGSAMPMLLCVECQGLNIEPCCDCSRFRFLARSRGTHVQGHAQVYLHGVRLERYTVPAASFSPSASLDVTAAGLLNISACTAGPMAIGALQLCAPPAVLPRTLLARQQLHTAAE